MTAPKGGRAGFWGVSYTMRIPTLEQVHYLVTCCEYAGDMQVPPAEALDEGDLEARDRIVMGLAHDGWIRLTSRRTGLFATPTPEAMANLERLKAIAAAAKTSYMTDKASR